MIIELGKVSEVTRNTSFMGDNDEVQFHRIH